MSTNTPPTSPAFAPFRIEPSFVGRVWGFEELRPWYNRTAVGDGPIGEVWLTGDECLIASGPHAGQTLGSLFHKHPSALLGPQSLTSESPLLLKVIFAREKLSVQVHPDDRMAQRYGQPRGKTECWYTLAAEPGAQVACGLHPGTTLEKVKDEIQSGTLEESLKLLSVAVGDVIYVDAGTVHSIWPGSILLETQQNCDLTYRMYDYGRARELHIERSLEALRLESRAGKIPPKELADRTVLADVEYFCIERIPVIGSRSSASLRGEDEPTQGLSYIFAAAGAGRITAAGQEPVDLPVRGIVAVPALSPSFAVENLGGLELMRISPRWPAMAV